MMTSLSLFRSSGPMHGGGQLNCTHTAPQHTAPQRKARSCVSHVRYRKCFAAQLVMRRAWLQVLCLWLVDACLPAYCLAMFSKLTRAISRHPVAAAVGVVCLAGGAWLVTEMFAVEPVFRSAEGEEDEDSETDVDAKDVDYITDAVRRADVCNRFSKSELVSLYTEWRTYVGCYSFSACALCSLTPDCHGCPGCQQVQVQNIDLVPVHGSVQNSWIRRRHRCQAHV